MKYMKQKQQRQEAILKLKQAECDDDFFAELPVISKYKVRESFLNLYG